VRGRKPKPAHLKLLTGNPGCRPVREEVQPTPLPGIPDPPAMLSAEARTEWLRIAPEAYNMGLLTTADIQSLAAYCQAYGRWIVAERSLAGMAAQDQLTGGLMIRTVGGNAIQNPIVGVANKAMSDMVRYAAEFGLTPAARARIAGPDPRTQSTKYQGLFG
jgi:P27 family predicted phage terminase small subunit